MKNAGTANPIGLLGIEFVEFVSPEPQKLEKLFYEFGFSKLKSHRMYDYDYFNQNDIHFILNKDARTMSHNFARLHGPSISAMGWRVKNAKAALEEAVKRGARACTSGDYINYRIGQSIPAIYGIGGSVIYFIETTTDALTYESIGFEPIQNPTIVPAKGFLAIDHLTNNVENGTMTQWANFYKNVFGFTEVRYFDIRGAKTGLQSYALKSPCGSFCIPINEGTEDKSQINEYLREYHGPGIQHLAFLTDNIIESVRALKSTSVQTLKIDQDYYDEVFDRVPNVREDHKKIRDLNILVDGDEEGYLLQIFTKNIIGPIFIEIIQRHNHHSFGEGNFGALFRSIEKDQEERGVL